MVDIQKPALIQHNGVNYYNATDLRAFDSTYFFRTSRSIRKIISLKNIPSSSYHYATFSKKFGWTSCAHQDKPPCKAKLLLKEDWVNGNVPKMMTSPSEDNYEYKKAPDVLYLTDNEKFKTDDGKIAEIEARGERNPKGIYFNIKDVSRCFNMPNIHNYVIDPDASYTEGRDYVIFLIELNNNKHLAKRIFMTYQGMLRILFVNQTGCASKFIDWATETLFVAQMGTREQKMALGAKMIGQPVKNVQSVFRKSSKRVPCVYRFSLGRAKALRAHMNLPKDIKDDFIIIKYGLTEDLNRRSGELMREYEKIKNVKLGLMGFSYIDPQFLQQAENDVKDFFKTYGKPVKYEKYQELVAINPKDEKCILKHYRCLAIEYQGQISGLIIEIEKLKLQAHHMSLYHSKELENKDLIIGKKDLMISLKEKELECERLKNQLGGLAVQQ